MVTSAYTELFNVIHIKHVIWHLQVASIIYTSDKKLTGSSIKEIFNIASNSVYIKSAQITAIVNTDIAFGQVLRDNEKFNEFVTNYEKNFNDSFNMDTIFVDYFCLNNSDPNLNWLPGMKENIKIIKTFVDKVIDKYKTLNKSYFIGEIISFFDNSKLKDDINSLRKLLYMLFVIGTAFHSTTIDFSKLCLTDAFNPKLWKKAGVVVLMGTFATDFSQVFGDTDLYSGDNFKTEISWLSTKLDSNRNKVHNEIVKYNPLFKYTTFSDREDMNKAGTTNSYTTYF